MNPIESPQNGPSSASHGYEGRGGGVQCIANLLMLRAGPLIRNSSSRRCSNDLFWKWFFLSNSLKPKEPISRIHHDSTQSLFDASEWNFSPSATDSRRVSESFSATLFRGIQLHSPTYLYDSLHLHTVGYLTLNLTFARKCPL
ncbi:hypothetical protein CEXT_797061 [Caerostris extrusa]|uniref:Uncharacterized protein n=1 Tax=Caerostris extrusa TaxID=172846 RepID=A0AAV4QBZ0_CAEEX|nr:hypothetical protein CEXT_797061 [Caerostris extrusa]